MDNSRATIAIPLRFCGPPDAANGGYAAGLLAQYVPGTAEVTLRRPVPLETELPVECDDAGARIRAGDGSLVAEAVPARVDVERPPVVDLDSATRASARCPLLLHPDWHPFPGCFVCGPDRLEGDGLRIFPGPVAGASPVVHAAPWTPTPDLADASGDLPVELVWAALDCPSSCALYDRDGERPDAPYVLGRIAARIDALPRVGLPHVLTAWRIGLDGRKLRSGSALMLLDGTVLAVALATWIRL